MGRLYRTAVVTVLLLSVLSPTCQVFGVKLCGRAFLRATFLVCGMHKRSGHDATRQQDFSESRPPGYQPPSIRTSRSSLLHDDVSVRSTLSSLPTYSTTKLPTLAPFDFWNVASVIDLARLSADETREEEKRRGRGRGRARGRGRPRGRGRYAYKGIADYCCRKGCNRRQLAVVC
ncbi:PREDICTED: uncharacterized protein LOC109477363 [Branchiostoma belcheri]|uniref:Uncharacterized protein LOC109477363 n=1 Tax=Branchiostoma belcheri TaxID=7741 RepID=A0A6P4ZT61_BRABE|nr:PREDICTED: uncharacterized protein LOC109477363 [Branchiostoma belcheri]